MINPNDNIKLKDNKYLLTLEFHKFYALKSVGGTKLLKNQNNIQVARKKPGRPRKTKKFR